MTPEEIRVLTTASKKDFGQFSGKGLNAMQLLVRNKAATPDLLRALHAADNTQCSTKCELGGIPLNYLVCWGHLNATRWAEGEYNVERHVALIRCCAGLDQGDDDEFPPQAQTTHNWGYTPLHQICWFSRQIAWANIAPEAIRAVFQLWPGAIHELDCPS